jgi:hypothetical protein
MYTYFTVFFQIAFITVIVFAIIRTLFFMALKVFQDVCYVDAVQLELDVKKKLAKGLISEEVAQCHIKNIVTFRKSVVKNDAMTVVENLTSVIESIAIGESDIAVKLFLVCWFYLVTKSFTVFLVTIFVFFIAIQSPQKQKTSNYWYVNKTRMKNDMFSILSSIPFSQFVRQ